MDHSGAPGKQAKSANNDFADEEAMTVKTAQTSSDVFR